MFHSKPFHSHVCYKCFSALLWRCGHEFSASTVAACYCLLLRYTLRCTVVRTVFVRTTLVHKIALRTVGSALFRVVFAVSLLHWDVHWPASCCPQPKLIAKFVHLMTYNNKWSIFWDPVFRKRAKCRDTAGQVPLISGVPAAGSWTTVTSRRTLKCWQRQGNGNGTVVCR